MPDSIAMTGRAIASTANSRRLAVTANVFSVCLVAALCTMFVAGALGPHSSAGGVIGSSHGADLPLVAAFALVGALLVLKRPENLVGWALTLAGLGLLLSGVLDAYGRLAVIERPELGLPGGIAAESLSIGAWTPLMAGVFLLILVFPSGRFSSPAAARWAALVLGGLAAVWFVLTTSPGSFDAPFDGHTNPLAVTGSKKYVLIAFPVIGSCLASLVVASGLAIRRFRKSHGAERQQFKWLAVSAGLLAVTLPFAAVFNYSTVPGIVFEIELIALPVSVGIAVLRYRLYEIDRIISRTLLYGSLTVILGAGYTALVFLGQALLSPFGQGSNLAIAASTLTIAGLFLPLRARTQRFIDRRFYRRRYDARHTLETFGARLRDQVELDRLSAEIESVVYETMQPAHLSLWLRQSESRIPDAGQSGRP